MSYQVSARKWRPQLFSEVVGQQHIVRTLVNAISTGKLSHAYLFAGTRGVGKTTMARLLAKAMNCTGRAEGSDSVEPCNSCPNCTAISAGSHMDIIEIDGASNNSVEDIRELRERVMYAPALARRKVYIIDEIHMLSAGAFNALLKTLEEPPPMVNFIFATTALNKIPETIRSRCQCFEFRSISAADIAKQLGSIAKREGFEISPFALETVARRAEGSMRDAESLFDQVIAFTETNTVRDDDIFQILGLVNQSVYQELIDAVIARDYSKIFEFTKSIDIAGYDPMLFVKELAEYVRHMIVAKVASAPEKLVSLPSESLARLKIQAGQLQMEMLMSFFQTLARAEGDMRYSSQPVVALEMALVKMVHLDRIIPAGAILERLARLQQMLAGGLPPAGPGGPGRGPSPATPAGQTRAGFAPQDSAQRDRYTRAEEAIPAQALADTAKKATVINLFDRDRQPEPSSGEAAGDTGMKHDAELFVRLAEEASSRKPILGGYLVNASTAAVDAQRGIVEILFPVGAEKYCDLVNSKENLIALQESATALLGRPVRVSFRVDATIAASAAAASGRGGMTARRGGAPVEQEPDSANHTPWSEVLKESPIRPRQEILSGNDIPQPADTLAASGLKQHVRSAIIDMALEVFGGKVAGIHPPTAKLQNRRDVASARPDSPVADDFSDPGDDSRD